MRLPTPDAAVPKEVRGYLIRLIQSIMISLDDKTDRNVPQASVLLASPNGSVYTVRVADDGTLTTEIVYDKS